MNYLTASHEKDLLKFISDKKIKRIFLLTGHNSFKKSGAYKLLNNTLKLKNVFYYFKESSYPVLSELKKIIIQLDKYKPDLILAIGGGSVIDYSKISNIFKSDIDLKKIIMESNNKNKGKKYKLAVVPTTAGSGAEVTANAVVYINNKKFSVEHENLKPNYYFLVPKLVFNAEKKIKASAGFDAISQSIESIISRKSNATSINYAKKSLELSFRKFENYVNKPTIDNTFHMCVAANLSGKAISITKTTAPHALSYPFTAHFNISHGHAVSLTLNDFLKFNYNFKSRSNCNFNLGKRFEDIFKIAKVKNINEFDMYLSKLKKNTKLENSLGKLGINIKRDIDKIISGININRLNNNPVKLNTSIIKTILLNKK